jgi:hypothetical protein
MSGSKELLKLRDFVSFDSWRETHPEFESKGQETLIDQTIALSKALKWPALWILRKEKRDLNDYLKEKISVDDEIIFVEPTREWPETILKSSEYWFESNLVLLPDTVFSPKATLEHLYKKLNLGAEAVFALHEVREFKTWGVVCRRKQKFWLCEKPQDLSENLRNEQALAWGIFGFHKNRGEALLESMLKSTLTHNWFALPEKTETCRLDHFLDLSRDGLKN